HREHGIGAARLGLLAHPFEGLVARLLQLLGQSLELAADEGLEPGAELGADVAGANCQPGALAEHPVDPPARHVVHRGNQQGHLVSRPRDRAPSLPGSCVWWRWSRIAARRSTRPNTPLPPTVGRSTPVPTRSSATSG